jgi:hypothetical protein
LRKTPAAPENIYHFLFAFPHKRGNVARVRRSRACSLKVRRGKGAGETGMTRLRQGAPARQEAEVEKIFFAPLHLGAFALNSSAVARGSSLADNDKVAAKRNLALIGKASQSAIPPFKSAGLAQKTGPWRESQLRAPAPGLSGLYSLGSLAAKISVRATFPAAAKGQKTTPNPGKSG